MAVEPRSRLREMTGGNDNVPAVIDDDAGMMPRVRYKKTQTIDPGSVKPQAVYLTQALSRKVTDGTARPGQWATEGFPAYDEITIIPFATQHVRSYQPDRNMPPQCVAPEGDFGYGDPGGVCEECPLSKWGPKNPATGKSTQPPCTEAIMVRAYSCEHRSLVDITFKKGDMAKGRLIASQALSRHFGQFAVKLGATKASNNLGTWYTIASTILDGVPDEHAEDAGKWQVVNDALMDMDAGDAGPAPF